MVAVLGATLRIRSWGIERVVNVLRKFIWSCRHGLELNGAVSLIWGLRSSGKVQGTREWFVASCRDLEVGKDAEYSVLLQIEGQP